MIGPSDMIPCFLIIEKSIDILLFPSQPFLILLFIFLSKQVLGDRREHNIHYLPHEIVKAHVGKPKAIVYRIQKILKLFIHHFIYRCPTHHMAKMPERKNTTDPTQNAIVRLFHFLCHCSSSFSNCLKYSRYLSLLNTALYAGI